MLHRNQWYRQPDDIFSIEHEWSWIIGVEEKIAEARSAVFADSEDQKVVSWLRWVQRWVDNLRHDLVQDSVPSPCDPDHAWLLFRDQEMHINAETRAITCSLCKHCKAALSRVTGDNCKPDARMPWEA